MRGCGESIKPMILVCLGICVLRIAWLTFISPHYPTIKGVVVSYSVTGLRPHYSLLFTINTLKSIILMLIKKQSPTLFLF